jgi:hypothetical protein
MFHQVPSPKSILLNQYGLHLLVPHDLTSHCNKIIFVLLLVCQSKFCFLFLVIIVAFKSLVNTLIYLLLCFSFMPKIWFIMQLKKIICLHHCYSVLELSFENTVYILNNRKGCWWWNIFLLISLSYNIYFGRSCHHQELQLTKLHIYWISQLYFFVILNLVNPQFLLPYDFRNPMSWLSFETSIWIFFHYLLL